MQQSIGDSYALVALIFTFRLFISIGTLFETSIRQVDVTSAYLYGKLTTSIYIALPAAHPRKHGNSNVWKSGSPLYGLVQSPKVWNDTFSSSHLRDLHRCEDLGGNNLKDAVLILLI